MLGFDVNVVKVIACKLLLTTGQQLPRWATVSEKSGPKSGGCCAPFRVEELGPHLTQCRLGRGLPPHEVVLWYLIHPAVWPQCTNVTIQTDNGRIA